MKLVSARILSVCIPLTLSASALAGEPTPSSTPATRLAPGAAKPAGWKDPGPFKGPMHEKHKGEVVFGSAPIAMDAGTEAGFITTYNLGDPLYIRFWGDESPRNIAKCNSEYRNSWRVTVNGGEELAIGVGSLDSDIRGLLGVSTISGDAKIAVTKPVTLRTPEADDLDRVVAWNGAVVPRLKEGDNEVDVRVTIDCGHAQDTDPVMAQGKLKIVVAPGAKAKYAAKFGPLLPKSKHRENKAIVKGLVETMSAQWPNEDIIGGVVIGGDWSLVRNEWTGVTDFRHVDTMVVAHLKKEPNPEVCRAFTVSVKQLPTQSGFAPEILFNGVGSDVEVPCSIAR